MFDSDNACKTVNRMRLRLARQIEKMADGEDTIAHKLRLARCAEACYWQATGEGTTNDLKDVI